MTVTTSPPGTLEPKPPARKRRPIDPDHDIDAKKTIILMTVSGLTLFVSLWLLLQLFSVVILDVRIDKIEAQEPAALQELRQQEEALHRAQMRDDGTQQMSIEEAMRRVVEGR